MLVSPPASPATAHSESSIFLQKIRTKITAHKCVVMKITAQDYFTKITTRMKITRQMSPFCTHEAVLTTTWSRLVESARHPPRVPCNCRTLCIGQGHNQPNPCCAPLCASLLCANVHLCAPLRASVLCASVLVLLVYVDEINTQML